jgi:hypothetical protein
MKIRLVEAELFHVDRHIDRETEKDRQTDRQTEKDRHDESNSGFMQFCDCS